MKKIFFILLVLLTTSAAALADEIQDSALDDTLTEQVKEEPFVETVEEEPLLETVEEEPLLDTVKDEPLVDTAKEEPLLDKASQINLIQDDEQKVKEWSKYNSAENYVIINKKDCSATVYDKEGNEIKSFEVGVGSEIGDDFNDTRGLVGKPKNTTPAGEFTLIPNIFNKASYGDLTLSLGKKANKTQDTKKVVALHKVPNFRQKDRLKKFYDGNLANNRMSHGCINFTEADFKELTKHIRGGLKLYVLPEEKDNKLVLEKNDKNELELTQTKY